MEYREGQTATNPKTGQKVVYRGGQWVSAGAAPAPRPTRLTPQEQIALRDAREAATGSDEAARTAEQFIEINRKQSTGGLWALPIVGDIAGAFDPEVNQLNALAARMAPQQRVPGSGTTSDRDLSLYLQAVPGLGKPGPANSAIARQARADADRRAAYAEFLDRWAAEKGTLTGALEAWRSSQAKPAAKPSKPQARPAATPAKPAPGKRLRFNPATGDFD